MAKHSRHHRMAAAARARAGGGLKRGAKAAGMAAVGGIATHFALQYALDPAAGKGIKVLKDHWYAAPGGLLLLAAFLFRKWPGLALGVAGAAGLTGYDAYKEDEAHKKMGSGAAGGRALPPGANPAGAEGDAGAYYGGSPWHHHRHHHRQMAQGGYGGWGYGGQQYQPQYQQQYQDPNQPIYPPNPDADAGALIDELAMAARKAMGGHHGHHRRHPEGAGAWIPAGGVDAGADPAW